MQPQMCSIESFFRTTCLRTSSFRELLTLTSWCARALKILLPAQSRHSKPSANDNCDESADSSTPGQILGQLLRILRQWIRIAQKTGLPVVNDTDFRAVHRLDRTGREQRSTGSSPGMWETLAVRAGASMPTAVNGSDSGETPMRWRSQERRTWRRRETERATRMTHTSSAFIRRGRTPTQKSVAHQDFGPGSRLSGTPSRFHSTHTHTGLFSVYVVVHAQTNTWTIVDPWKGVGPTTLPNATGRRCSGTVCGVADGVSRLCAYVLLICMSGVASVRVCLNCTGHRTRDTRCALRSLTSWLQHYVEPLGHPDSTLDSTDWYLRAALAHLNVHARTYTARRSSFNTVMVDAVRYKERT